jgi:hypothetical protein
MHVCALSLSTGVICQSHGVYFTVTHFHKL